MKISYRCNHYLKQYVIAMAHLGCVGLTGSGAMVGINLGRIELSKA